MLFSINIYGFNTIYMNNPNKTYLRVISPIEEISPSNIIFAPNVLIKVLNKLGFRFARVASANSCFHFL